LPCPSKRQTKMAPFGVMSEAAATAQQLATADAACFQQSWATQLTGTAGSPAGGDHASLTPGGVDGFGTVVEASLDESTRPRGSCHVKIPRYISTKLATRQITMTIKPMYQYSQSSVPSIRGAISNDTIAMSFNKISREGPEVSLKGSPTVSPTMQALPWSDF